MLSSRNEKKTAGGRKNLTGGEGLTIMRVFTFSEMKERDGEKMSKSKGNLITINDIIDKYGKDTVRYFMIANGPEKKDSNFSEEDLIMAHNKFLVGGLGNFINRNVSFINKKFDIKKMVFPEEVQTIMFFQNYKISAKIRLFLFQVVISF